MPVTATWQQSGGQPDVSHQFDGFSGVAEEQSMARIYGGIHYRFDQVAGQQHRKPVAEYVFANFMTPRRPRTTDGVASGDESGPTKRQRGDRHDDDGNGRQASEALANELKGRVRGPVLTPADAGYDEARSIWNAMIDRRPALIVRCLGVADVVACVARRASTGCRSRSRAAATTSPGLRCATAA